MAVSEQEKWQTLHEPFSIERHKQTFSNYLEVIIREDGTVEYAVPSHNEKLVSIIVEQRGITRGDVVNLCPEEYYFEYNKWLCMTSGCISVWNDFVLGNPNETQKTTLRELRSHGLYRGDVPEEA